MTPPPKGKPKYDTKRAWAEARALIWEHRTSVTVGLVLMIFSRAAGFVLPYSTKYVLDDVLPNRDIRMLGYIALAGLAATIVQSITGYALSQVVSVAAQQAIARLREEVQGHLIRLPVKFFDSTKSGVLVSRVMSDPEGIRNLIGTGLIQLTGGIVSAIAALGVLFYLNWRLTAATIVFLAMFGVVMSIAFKRLRPIFRERSVITAEVTGRLTETLGGIRLIKVYTAEEREKAVFGQGVQKLFQNIAKTITGTSLTGTLGLAVVGVIGLIAMYVGGRDVINGDMTVGSLITFVFFIVMVTAPLIQIASIGTQITEAFAGLDRIRELRDMATEDQEDANKTSVPSVVGRVEFDHVSFEYDAGNPVLRDVSFTAPAGTTTALVGSSGSGKSTLANALDAELHGRGIKTVLLDGDNVRHGLCGDLGFSAEDRHENLRRIAEVAKLMADTGLVVLTAFVSPYRSDRARAREIIGPERFAEIYVNTPVEVCATRDVKGLYAKAQAGLITDFTGVNSPYEAPLAPELTVASGTETLTQSAAHVLQWFDAFTTRL